MIGSLRILVHAAGSFRANLVGIQAAGLTMFTLLALFPLLWLGFGVANLLGFSDLLMDRLGEFGEEVPANLQDVVVQLQGMLDRVNEQALELWGSLLLAYTGYTLFTKVELAINGVWKTHHRSWYRRLGSFLGLVLVVPMLVLGAIIGQSILAQMPWIGAGVRVLPLVGLWLALTAFYKWMPSAPVHWFAAVVAGGGAAVAGVGLHSLYLAAQFGVARYNAVYAALAVIPMLLIYLELWWTVVLAGAEVSYAIQNLHSLGPKREVPPLSHALRRRMALALMQAVTDHGGAALPLARFTAAVDAPRPWVDQTVSDLERGNLLEMCEDDSVRRIEPTGPLSAWDVVAAVDGPDPDQGMELPAGLEESLVETRAALRDHLDGVRFRPSASS